jgi:hypothetical protein
VDFARPNSKKMLTVVYVVILTYLYVVDKSQRLLIQHEGFHEGGGGFYEVQRFS